MSTQGAANTHNMLRVRFACDENAVRSPMAEGLARDLYGNRIDFGSVGVRPGGLNMFAMVVLNELGINIADHEPSGFDTLDSAPCDLIISLTPEAQHHAIEYTRDGACEVEYWPTQDPTHVHGSRETILDSYREVRDHLAGRIEKRFADQSVQ